MTEPVIYKCYITTERRDIMKLKVDQYKVYNKGRVHKVIVFPRMDAAWAYDDNPEDDQLMLDGSMEFYQQIHHALAALIADPSLIIYFPIKHPKETRFGGQMTYDAVLLRPELQFRRSEWYDIKSKLDKKHWVGKYTIRHNEKKLNNIQNLNLSGAHQELNSQDKQVN